MMPASLILFGLCAAIVRLQEDVVQSTSDSSIKVESIVHEHENETLLGSIYVINFDKDALDFFRLKPDSGMKLMPKKGTYVQLLDLLGGYKEVWSTKKRVGNRGMSPGPATQLDTKQDADKLDTKQDAEKLDTKHPFLHYEFLPRRVAEKVRQTSLSSTSKKELLAPLVGNEIEFTITEVVATKDVVLGRVRLPEELSDFVYSSDIVENPYVPLAMREDLYKKVNPRDDFKAIINSELKDGGIRLSIPGIEVNVKLTGKIELL